MILSQRNKKYQLRKVLCDAQVKLLNVNLPAGWLQPLLGSAGI